MTGEKISELVNSRNTTAMTVIPQLSSERMALILMFNFFYWGEPQICRAYATEKYTSFTGVLSWFHQSSDR
jgi:hypothetical protein